MKAARCQVCSQVCRFTLSFSSSCYEPTSRAHILFPQHPRLSLLAARPGLAPPWPHLSEASPPLRPDLKEASPANVLSCPLPHSRYHLPVTLTSAALYSQALSVSLPQHQLSARLPGATSCLLTTQHTCGSSVAHLPQLEG